MHDYSVPERYAVRFPRFTKHRINLPHGFEYRVAEMASGTTRTTGAISLANNKDSHAHICRVYMNGQGVIEHAA